MTFAQAKPRSKREMACVPSLMVFKAYRDSVDDAWEIVAPTRDEAMVAAVKRLNCQPEDVVLRYVMTRSGWKVQPGSRRWTP